MLRDRFRQQAPELRVMPAQVVPAAVAVGANARAKPGDFGCELIPGQACKVVIHPSPTRARLRGSSGAARYR